MDWPVGAIPELLRAVFFATGEKRNPFSKNGG